MPPNVNFPTPEQIRLLHERLEAFHEAGHAVVAQVIGLKIEFVTVQHTEQYRGHTSLIDEDEFFDSDENTRAHVICTLAGWAAAALVREDMGHAPTLSWIKRAANEAKDTDIPTATRTLYECLGVELDEIEGEIDRNLERAIQVVRFLRPEITRVAEQLILRRTITGQDVDAAIESPKWNERRNELRAQLGL